LAAAIVPAMDSVAVLAVRGAIAAAADSAVAVVATRVLLADTTAAGVVDSAGPAADRLAVATVADIAEDAVVMNVIAASNVAGPPDGPEQRPVATLAVAAPANAIDAARRKSWIGMRRKGIIALLALVPLIALASLAWHLLSRPKGSGFRTVRVVRADITERVTATGTLQPVITSPVGAQVSGIVGKLHADFNSAVKAGDLLVELDSALFQNAVAMATAQLAQAKANLTSAHASARGAVSVRDRTRLLESKSLVSGADLDASEAVFGQTAGQTRSGAAQIAQAYAQLDKAKLDYQHSIIRSPVDGTVISRNIDVGQAVAATLTAPTLFTIAQDLHHMQVHAAVDEANRWGRSCA
jgi:biotin carboxyl carrier protein